MNDKFVAELPPCLADRFEPVQELGRGRTSTVVRARRRDGNEEAALKILHPYLAEEGAVRRRLVREMAAVRRLNHPAVVGLQELIDETGCVALVMDFVAGETVRRRVERSGPMNWEQARQVLDGVLGAVHQAHGEGILHRDLNANHILIDDSGEGRIVGFGLARVDEMVALTMHTQVLGSLEAMAPERLLGLHYDGRADIYSVGAVAYELMVGRPPQDGWRSGPDETELAALPEQARYVLERALVADVGARFATAQQMRRALAGDYDEALWRGWASRKAEDCPSCEMPVVDGITSCVHCGHEFQRLVQQPGRGHWMIPILSHREAFEADVWFEQNTEPDYFKDEPFRGLMELLEAHEDTRHLADWSVSYRWPPYFLLDRLTAADARRIGAELEAIGVPHRVVPWQPTRWRRLTKKANQRLGMAAFLESEGFDGEADARWEEGHQHTILGEILAWMVVESPILRRPARALFQALTALFYLVFLAPFLFLINLNRREFVMILVGSIFLGWFWVGLAPALELSSAATNTALASFGLGWLAMLVLGPVLKRRIGAEQERPTISGQPLMITPEELARVDTAGGAELLPEGVGKVLSECESDEVRKEIHELIVLAVNVARRASILEHQSFRAVVEEILVTGERLDECVQQAHATPTATLYDRLESVELRWEEADDEERGVLQEQRKEIMSAMAAQDAVLDEMTALRTTLQLARGRLFDLLGGVDTADDEVLVQLELGAGPEDELIRLSQELSARQEVAHLVGAP